jgi:hypothetical protein
MIPDNRVWQLLGYAVKNGHCFFKICGENGGMFGYGTVQMAPGFGINDHLNKYFGYAVVR